MSIAGISITEKKIKGKKIKGKKIKGKKIKGKKIKGTIEGTFSSFFVPGSVFSVRFLVPGVLPGAEGGRLLP